MSKMSHEITTALKRRNAVWWLTTVYASPIATVTSFWNHLESLSNNVHDPWLLTGDFNEVVSPSEVKGGLFSQSRANAFASMMDNCNLLHLAKNGGRPLNNWHLRFPEASVEVLPRHYSDHHPLFLRCSGIDRIRGIRTFRFEAAWASHQDYG